MTLAVLSIDIEAKLAKFEADLGKAARALDKLATDAKGSFAGVGQVFAGSFLASAAEEGVKQLVALFPALIDGVAAFQDLSEETGASAVALASFQTAADVSGVSVKDLGGMMVRLTGNLAKLTDEGKGAGAALGALGIPIKEFRALSPDEQIKRLSTEFGKFEDSSSKTAVALALFGKSGAQVLKFFKEYEGSASSSIKLTAEMIAQADAFGDAHAKSRSQLRQTAQVIAVQLLPAITAIEDGFREGGKAVIGFKSEAGGLDPRVVLDFAETGAIAVGTLAEALIGVLKTARAVGGSFQAVGADLQYLNATASVANPLAAGSFTERIDAMRGALDNRNKVAAEANQRYLDLWNYNGTAITDSLRKSFAEQRRALDPENIRELARMREKAGEVGGKPALKFTLPPASDGERDKSFQRFMAQIAKQDEVAQAQLDTGGKLAESDKRRIDLLSELSDASKGYTISQQQEGKVAAEGLIAKLRRFEVEHDLIKVRAAAQGLEDRAVAAQGKEIESLISGNEALRDQIEEIGLTSDQVEKLRITRLEHKAAMEGEALIMLQNAEASAAQISSAERSIELLRQQIELRKKAAARTEEISKDPTKGASDALDSYLSKIEQSGTATREAVSQTLGLLEDDLVNSLASGKFSVTRTINFIIAEFMRLAVVRPLLGSLFSAFGLSAVSGSANGNAFGPGGPIAFANGGIFDSPTLFKFASGSGMSTGVMGEAGPEAIMPLQRGPGGKLGVRAMGGGGGGVTVVQYNTIGSNVSRAEVAVAMEHAKRSTIAALADAQRRGRAVA